MKSGRESWRTGPSVPDRLGKNFNRSTKKELGHTFISIRHGSRCDYRRRRRLREAAEWTDFRRGKRFGRPDAE